MGTYCRVVTKYYGSDCPICEEEEPLALNQSYTTFAILAGVRNYLYIKPIFDERPPEDDMVKYTRGGDNRWYSLFGPYYLRTWFTIEEFEAFDFDQPIQPVSDSFIVDHLSDRRKDVLCAGDTYRTLIERETGIFEWIAALKADGVEKVYLAFD
jgi:hypothetical protein